MSLKVIAALAGTSISTVSKAFSDSTEISVETKNRILDIAKQQGIFYKYNKNKYDKKLIAVISPEIKSDFYNSFLNILNREIKEQGGIMTVSITEFSKEKIEELFAYYSFYCVVDGIILLDNNTIIDNAHKIPAVSITPFEGTESANVDLIKLDSLKATEEAIKHLKENGHTKIGFAGEKLTAIGLETFRIAMKNVGMPVKDEFIKISSKRYEEAGVEIMEEWLAEDDRPTAIIAAYDYIAIGIINVLRKHHYGVPEDFSVVGMDDIAILPYLTTPLSTIKRYSEETCKLAVEMLMNKISNENTEEEDRITISADFVVRQSSGIRCKKEPCKWQKRKENERE